MSKPCPTTSKVLKADQTAIRAAANGVDIPDTDRTEIAAALTAAATTINYAVVRAARPSASLRGSGAGPLLRFYEPTGPKTGPINHNLDKQLVDKWDEQTNDDTAEDNPLCSVTVNGVWSIVLSRQSESNSDLDS